MDGELDAESGSQGHVTESVHTEHTTSVKTEDGDDEKIAEDCNVCISEKTDDPANAPIPVDNETTDGSVTSLARQPADVRLKHGQEIIISPETGGATCFRSSRIELLVDEASTRFSLELFGAKEAEAVLRDKTRPVTDVRNMASGIDVLLSKCASGEVYIAHGEEVIRVCPR